MGEAKSILLRPIGAATANDFIRRVHYSGTVTRNSQLHVGVFLGGVMHGAMSLGPPLDRSNVIGLVRDTPWNGFLELNRLAFTEQLPRNSESRALGVLARLLRKHRPDLQWLLSFADGTQCGDGTIYRAAGFLLTDVRKSENLARFPWGVKHKLSYQSNPASPRPELGGRSYLEVCGGRQSWRIFVTRCGGEILSGFQLRYLLPLDPTAPGRLTVPVLPYSTIDTAGAAMYRGARGRPRGTCGDQP